MRMQLIATMRSDYARRYAADRSLLDAPALLRGLASAELVGAPGYSMRISIDQRDWPALEQRLTGNFIVQPDHILQTFR